MSKQVQDMPSQTALFTALRRALANKEYNDARFGPDLLAEVFLPAYYRFFLKFARVREGTKGKLAAFMPGMNEYIIARTAFFDGLFVDALKNQIPQIVLLGAGYDSRAYRFANLNSGTRIYELDAAPTQNRKKKCLRAAHVSIPAHVRFVPIDFLNESLGDVLARAGYQSEGRTLFLWEGVSYYLDWASVEKTLGFVSSFSHEDSIIAFDYTIPLSEEAASKHYGTAQFMQSMQEHHANEQLLFAAEHGKIESFLAQTNLVMIEHMDNETIERKYLTDEDGSLIGRITGNFRFVCASPRKG